VVGERFEINKQAKAAYEAYRHNYLETDTPFEELSVQMKAIWEMVSEAAIEEWESNFDPPE